MKRLRFIILSLLFPAAILLLSACNSSIQAEKPPMTMSNLYRTELIRSIEGLTKSHIHTHGFSDTCYYFSIEEEDRTQIVRYGLFDHSLDQSMLSLENQEILLSFAVNSSDEMAIALWCPDADESERSDDSLHCSLKLRTYGANGTLCQTYDLPEVKNLISFRGLVLGDNGSLAVCLEDRLHIYKNTGELQRTILLPREDAGELLMDQSLISVFTFHKEEITAEQYDITNGQQIYSQSLPLFRYLFRGEDGLYYLDESSLGQYDWEHSSTKPLLDLTIAGLDLSCLTAMAELQKGVFVASQWDAEGTALELMQLTPQSPDATPLPSPDAEEASRELIFATLNRGTFQNSVVRFNRSNPAYTIQFKSYDIDQLDMLNAALATDSEIDLVEITGRRYYNAYVSNEYLLDLMPFLQNSDKISLESFIEPVIREFVKEGHIYAIPRRVSIGTIACPSSILEGKESWTIDEFLEIMTLYPNAFSGNGRTVTETKEKILRTVLYYGLDDFVEVDEGRSMLGEGHFQQVLETIQGLPVTTSSLSPEERAEEGEMVIWEILDLLDTRTLQQLEWRSNEELTLIGYPISADARDASSAGLIHFDDYVGIHSTSQHPEGAWLYLEQYLTGAFTVSSLGFTTGADAFEEKLSEDMGEDYEEFILDGIPYPAITQEQSDKVRRAFESAVYYSEEQQSIVSLIMEEVEGYFNGEKSLEDTVQIIDNRIQLYLDEAN